MFGFQWRWSGLQLMWLERPMVVGRLLWPVERRAWGHQRSRTGQRAGSWYGRGCWARSGDWGTVGLYNASASW